MKTKVWLAGSGLIILLIAVIVWVSISPASQSGLTTIRVGYLPSLAAAQMYVGIDQGYFEQEGLSLEISEIYSAPDVIQALQSRSIDIGFGVVPSVALARANGVLVRCLVGATTDSAASQEHRLIVATDSPIDDVTDLIGKRIALVAEPTSDGIALFAYLSSHGIERSDLTFIKTPHPEMIVAVASGSVDAAASIEPFISEGRLGGHTRELVYYYPDDVTEVGTYIVHDDWLWANADSAEKFSRAILRATDWINSDSQRLRALLPQLGDVGIRFSVSAVAAEELHIPGFLYFPSRKGVEKLVAQLVQYGFLDQPIDPDLILPEKQ